MHNSPQTPERIATAFQSVGTLRACTSNPYDTIAECLDRASGIVAVLMDLADKEAAYEGPNIDAMRRHHALSAAALELEGARAVIDAEQAVRYAGRIRHD